MRFFTIIKEFSVTATAAMVTLLLTTGLLVATAAPAHADPFGCNAFISDAHSASAVCTSGSGTYRAVVMCIAKSAVFHYRRQGLISVRIGEISVARCSNPWDTPVEAQVQIVRLR